MLEALTSKAWLELRVMLVVLEMYYKWQKGTYRNKEAGSADILRGRKREGENRRKGGGTKEGKIEKKKQEEN